MRPKQGVALQNGEIDWALNQAFPPIQETLEKWTQIPSPQPRWQTVKVPHWWWPELRRDRCSSTNLSGAQGWATKQPGHQRPWLGQGVIVYHLSKQPEAMPRINLLLIEKAGNFHYTWIKNFNRLLYDQRKHKERKHLCERCLHGYTREDLLEAHKPECRWIGQTAVRVEMPEEGKNKLAFQNHTSSCQPLT